jgi:hypothetical protein
MPELPDPSLAWEDLSAEDRRALTELLVALKGDSYRLQDRDLGRVPAGTADPE